MKTRLIITLLIIFCALALFADENYHWYRASEGEDASAFPKIQVNEDTGDPGGPGGPEDPDDPWVPGDPDDPNTPGLWVLFAVSGKLEVNNTATVKGINGWNIGSNTSSSNRVIFRNYPNFYSDDFWIGKDADPLNANDVISILTSSWQNEGEPRKTFYNRLNNIDGESFKHLTKTIAFSDPSIGFPLKEEHFFPADLSKLEEKDDLITAWDSNFVISENGYYKNITINSNRKITLRVGTEDLVLKIDNLSISGIIEIIAAVPNPGRIFFFVNNSSIIAGSSRIGNATLADRTHFFYTGSTDINISGSASLYGTIYSRDAKINITGSGGVVDILSISDKVINFSPSGQIALDAIYAKYADITIGNTGKINEGIVTGGSNVGITNVNSFHYVYAPKALLTFGNTGTYEGSFIANHVIIDNVVTIQGPPVTEIPKPTIPQPVINDPIECFCSPDWLITLILNPSGKSIGCMSIPAEDGTVEFDDDWNYAFNNNDFEISFTIHNGKLRANVFWGYSSWYWDMDEFGSQLYNGSNLRVVRIYANDYEGKITVVNDTDGGLKVDIIEQNGHVNGNEIPKNKTYILSKKDTGHGGWESKQAK